MIRISIKWLIVLLLFALVVAAWLIDGGANRAKSTVGTASVFVVSA